MSDTAPCSITSIVYRLDRDRPRSRRDRRCRGDYSDKIDVSRECRSCRMVGPPSDLLMCDGCGVSRMPVHISCLRGNGDHGIDCDVIPFTDYAYITWLLDTRLLQDKSVSLHTRDLWTTWFGVPYHQNESPPRLFVWPRLQNLVNSAPKRPPPRQYPSLVSFVGPTGSGKSTIIKAIIRMLAPNSHSRNSVPVPGTNQDQFISTSSDVHLYADPRTISADVPIFLAGMPWGKCFVVYNSLLT